MPMNVLAELRTAIPRNLVCPSCAGPLNVCGYGKCPGCSAMVCPCCEAVNDPVHEGLKCCVYSLVKEAFAWVKETFPEAKTVAFNENLKNPECLAMKRFLMTVGELERVKHFKPMFAWHGSSKEGISGIAKNGFDTTKRRGQSYGPGEYFGYTANVSKGYSTASKVLIATLIVTSVEGYGEYLKTVVGTCYVVNNPHDVPNDKTFCLPLCLAAYEEGVISF